MTDRDEEAVTQKLKSVCDRFVQAQYDGELDIPELDTFAGKLDSTERSLEEGD